MEILIFPLKTAPKDDWCIEYKKSIWKIKRIKKMKFKIKQQPTPSSCRTLKKKVHGWKKSSRRIVQSGMAMFWQAKSQFRHKHSRDRIMMNLHRSALLTCWPNSNFCICPMKPTSSLLVHRKDYTMVKCWRPSPRRCYLPTDTWSPKINRSSTRTK